MPRPDPKNTKNIIWFLAFFGTISVAGCASTQHRSKPATDAPTKVSKTADQDKATMQQPLAETSLTETQNQLKPSAPERYVVVKGDTLWDISSHFLKDPWYWPEIWHANPQVKNPHLIYPGDVLTVFYVGGKPYIQVSDGPRVTRLAPHIRSEPLDDQDTNLPIQAIHQFIVRPQVVTKEVLDQAPYIVAAQDNRLIFGTGDRVYIRGLENPTSGSRFNVFRPGKVLRDPVTDELLGYEAILVGDATVIRESNPATATLTDTEREALTGDRLLPYDNDPDRNFVPHSPNSAIHGSIISLFNAISQIGQYQIAVINLGENSGTEKGHVLAIHEAGRTINDPHANGHKNAEITLPEEKTGIAIIFRTFDKVSYALVLDAKRPIQIGDAVRTP